MHFLIRYRFLTISVVSTFHTYLLCGDRTTFYRNLEDINPLFDNAYKDRGTPQPMKHTRAIHEKYCQLIDRHVGKSTDSGTTKSPKVPEPKAYSGKEDTKIFEGWLKNLLRWYHINMTKTAYHARPCSYRAMHYVGMTITLME